MKTKISDNGDYALYAELKLLDSSPGYSLKFTSVLKSANNPEEHNKLEIFLTADELLSLNKFLNIT